jgi:hypothetical protein
MVMTDNGKMSDVIDIRDTIAKRGSGRRIPMHPSALSHSNRGYSLFSFTRASAVVNCQSALV